MNPSYNDSFGSFGSGSPMSPGPIVSGPVAPEPMRSGAGDRKKWWVFLIVILIFAAVGGGVFALWKGGVFGGGSESKEENELQDLAVTEIFADYKALLIYGSIPTNEQSLTEPNEWAIGTLIAAGAQSAEDGEYLIKLKKYYDAFWALVDQEENIYKMYNQYFTLYYYCANRNGVIAEIDNVNVDEMIRAEDYDGILQALAAAENGYFKNYNNDDGAGFLTMAMDLIVMTGDSFKQLTNTIGGSLSNE